MLKPWIKKHLYFYYVRHKLMPEVGIQQKALFHQYQTLLAENRLPAFKDTGFRVFSQFEEDGKLLFLFSILGMGKKTFLEFGSDDGINSNSANLIFHHGWTGLFIDGNQTAINRGKHFFSKYPHRYAVQPRFERAMLTRENINHVIAQGGLEGEIDLMSVDVDGNDYWLWDAITQVNPRVVVIETHVEFGLEDKIVPYDPDYVYPGKHPLYHGASITAMTKLGEKKGYVLVGANDLGFNLFFVRKDVLGDSLPGAKPKDLLWHKANSDLPSELAEIKDWPYVQS